MIVTNCIWYTAEAPSLTKSDEVAMRHGKRQRESFYQIEKAKIMRRQKACLTAHLLRYDMNQRNKIA